MTRQERRARERAKRRRKRFFILFFTIILAIEAKSIVTGNDNKTIDKKRDDVDPKFAYEQMVNHEDAFSANTVASDKITYEEPILTFEEKIEWILDYYGFSYDEWLEYNAIVIAEAKPSSYEDQYCVSSTLLNRISSKTWIGYCEVFKRGCDGTKIYNQATAPGQFAAYKGNVYDSVYGTISEAVVDCLYDMVPSHDYLSFKAPGYFIDPNEDPYQFVDGGNVYHQHMEEKDRIVLEEVVRKR